MSKKLIIAVVIFIFAITFGIGIALKPHNGVQNVSANNGQIREFTVTGTNYAFNPSTITVNKGDNVKINFQDTEGTHNLIIEGYNIFTQTVGGGGADSISFVADKTGSFNFYCGISGHRELGMVGTLVVQ